MPEISVVIPSHNGYEQLISIIPKVFSALSCLGSSELVIVDDGSDEASRVALRAVATNESRIRLIRTNERKGQIHATLLGVALASGEIVITMDDDGSHPPELIPEMVRALRSNERIDLLYAAPLPERDPGGGRRPAVRRLGTRLNNFLFHRFLGLPPEVPVGSFRAIRRGLLHDALARPVRYPYLSAMLLSLDPGVTALRYRPPRRVENRRSRYRLGRLLSVWWALLIYWGPLKPLGSLLRERRGFLPETETVELMDLPEERR